MLKRVPRLAGVLARQGSSGPVLEYLCPVRTDRLGLIHVGLVEAGEEFSGDLRALARGQGERLPKNGF